MDSRLRGNDEISIPTQACHPRENGDPCRSEAAGGAEGVKAGSARWIPAYAGMTTLNISSCPHAVIPVKTGIHAGKRLRLVLSERRRIREMDSRLRGNDEISIPTQACHPRANGDPCRSEAAGGAEGVKAGSARWIPA
jgi:hypothetical protein